MHERLKRDNSFSFYFRGATAVSRISILTSKLVVTNMILTCNFTPDTIPEPAEAPRRDAQPSRSWRGSNVGRTSSALISLRAAQCSGLRGIRPGPKPQPDYPGASTAVLGAFTSIHITAVIVAWSSKHCFLSAAAGAPATAPAHRSGGLARDRGACRPGATAVGPVHATTPVGDATVDGRHCCRCRRVQHRYYSPHM